MKKLIFPEEWATDLWYGFKRHHFEFEGCQAWIVEPEYPSGDGRWSWCPMWPEAFVKRVGVPDLLNHGFYHVHLDAFSYRANETCMGIMGRFQEKLVGMGLSPKAKFIGMSWGGFYSLRYCITYPDRIAALYLDAPMCDAADLHDDPGTRERIDSICQAFGMTRDELKTSPLNPVNRTDVLVKAGFPMLAAVGEDDLVVNIDTNFNLLETRIKENGGTIEVMRRPAWGHHPHGLDTPELLLAFHAGARDNA